MSKNPFDGLEAQGSPSTGSSNPFDGMESNSATERAYDPTQGMSAGELALVGAGRRFAQIATLGGAIPWLENVGDERADAALMKHGAAQVGSIAADIGLSAIPLARGAQAVGRGIQGAQSAATGLRLLPALSGEAVVSGAYEGLTRPGTIGERAANAGYGAGFSVGGNLAMRGVGRAIGGPLSTTRNTPEATKLMAEGVPVPPWKATASPRLRDFGERAKASFLGRPVLTSAERRAFVEWNKNLVKNATPPRPVLNDSGRVARWVNEPVAEVSDNSLNILKSRFDEAYDALYKGRVIPVDEAFSKEVEAIRAATKRYFPQYASEIDGVLNRVDDSLVAVSSTTTKSPIVSSRTGQPFTNTQLGHAGATPSAVRDAIETVDESIRTAYRQGNGEKAEVLSEISDALRELRTRGLPPEVQGAAKEINKKYTNFLQLQKAHAMMGAQSSGLVTPKQVLSGMKSLDRSKGKAAFARGNVPNQADVLNAERVLGSRLPEVGPGTAEKLIMAGMFGSPFMLMGDVATGLGAMTLATQAGQRYAFGLLPYQQMLHRGAQNISPYSAQATRGIFGGSR